MRLSICAGLLCATALALPAQAQDMRGTLQEEVRMQHERARELTAIGQSDERMAQDLNNQAQQLDAHAQRLDQRARQFREMASANRFNPQAVEQMNRFAAECEKYAHSDRSNIEFRRRVANDMANSAHGAFDSAREHEEHANRMQGFLNQLNQQQPQQVQPQQGNPWK